MNLCAEENKKDGASKNKKKIDTFFIMNRVFCALRTQSFFI